ncbi:hypothetical protein ABW636_07505 [Aquimarina sp. 2201CG1-2-11]|uniref:hypothetical protein n=1 Tax=Aquimarina discodermiae TaxID=3231043 RepID=UPI00346363D1
MRIVFSILLFASFAIRPAIEVSTVLYYQLNMDTIIKKYCINKERPRLQCNGKCYLMNQMKAKTQSSSEEKQNIVISESFIPLFYQDPAVLIKSNHLIIEEPSKNWKLKHLKSKIILLDIDPPPRHRLS